MKYKITSLQSKHESLPALDIPADQYLRLAGKAEELKKEFVLSLGMKVIDYIEKNMVEIKTLDQMREQYHSCLREREQVVASLIQLEITVLEKGLLTAKNSFGEMGVSVLIELIRDSLQTEAPKIFKAQLEMRFRSAGLIIYSL